MYLYKGEVIQANKGWTDDEGYKHPKNWMIWDDAYKAAMGLVYVPNLTYYNTDGSQKPLEELKAMFFGYLSNRSTVEDLVDWPTLHTDAQIKYDVVFNAITAATSLEELEAIDMTFPEVPYVPEVVSMRQARLALFASDLLSTVEAAITEETARIEWEYATEVRYDSDLVASIASGLGLTSAQIKDLFILAGRM